MKFSSLVDGIADEVTLEDDPNILSMTIDIDKVEDGSLFIARKNWYGNTHRHIALAYDRGASAVLLSEHDAATAGRPFAYVHEEDPALGLISRRFFKNPTRHLTVYGVTGTNGKTSVTSILEHVLETLGERPALMGTLGYRFGDYTVKASNTTPDAIVIQRFAADVVKRGAQSLILEVSSHALEIGRVAGLDFDSVGFTNLTHDHLDFHGTERAYFEAKAKLFEPILKSSIQSGKTPTASIFLADHWADELTNRIPASVTLKTLSHKKQGKESTWTISGEPHALDRSTAVLDTDMGRVRVDVPFAADFYLANAALAASMVSGHIDADIEKIWAAISTFSGVSGRLERVCPDVFVDYAHTPDAVSTVLKALSDKTDKTITVVVGCGGDRDPSKRAAMARAACNGASYVVVTSDNPRSENPEAIIADMQPGLSGPHTIEIDRTNAIYQALLRGGVVLIAGKGHETTQTIGGHKYHFDDREEARRLYRGIQKNLTPAETPLVWGLISFDGADTAGAVDFIKRTQARRAGLWVVECARTDQHKLAAQTLLGDEVFWADSLDKLGALTPRHRALLVSPGLIPDCIDWVATGGITHWTEALNAWRRTQ